MTSIASAEFKRKVGARLAAVREQVKLSQSEFAATIGIAGGTYANYERGDRELSALVLGRLAQVHHVDLMWLVNGGDRERPRFTLDVSTDDRLFVECAQVAEAELKQAGLSFTPEKHYRFIYLCFRLAVESGKVDAANVRKLMALAA